MISLIAAVVSLAAILIRVAWERSQSAKAKANEPIEEIRELQHAATIGDEPNVQELFNRWRLRGRVAAAPAAGLRLFDPEGKGGRGAGGDGPSQDPTRAA